MTPLLLAVKEKHYDLMKYLVKGANADINIQAEKVSVTNDIL